MSPRVVRFSQQRRAGSADKRDKPLTRHLPVWTVTLLAGLAAVSAGAQPRMTASAGRHAEARALGMATIQGNTLTSTNGPLGDALVRLRDARTGRVVSTTTSDSAGLFEFRVGDPGSYVVELLARDQTTVVAASQILNVHSGELVSAIVRLPFRAASFERLLGHSFTSAAIVTSTAAAAGVLARQVSGDQVSPRR